MGKKGSWFSAIKRAFTTLSKEKLGNESEKKRNKKEKKEGVGKLRHGESNSSFIPLFGEPSSVEKIFLDFEREQQRIEFRAPTLPEQLRTPPLVTPRPASPKPPSPRPTATSPRGASPRVSPRASNSPQIVNRRKEIGSRPEPTLRNHHASATRIQAAYRGYMARRSFRALKGLVRLQGVVRGQNVKRQTINAMKQMQLLVRIQSQIQSRRIQMLESQARCQAQYNNDKEFESAFGKWNTSQASEAGNHDDWDDSLLTKEEVEARLQRKVEAEIKRERAMAYAYSHQSMKGTPKSSQVALTDIRSAGFPWWWNWVERQLPPSNPPESQTLKNFLLAPPTPQSEQKPTPRFHSGNHIHNQLHFESYNMDTPTPKSTKSTILPAKKPVPGGVSPSSFSRYSRSRARGTESHFDVPLKDDDSLTSCPPFSVPHYMAPTVSAKAKVRFGSNPKERIPGTPSTESKRRFSFPLAHGFASFKWNKGSLFSNKDSSTPRMIDKNQSLRSIGNLSVDSTVSLPAGVGRKPFNRFV